MKTTKLPLHWILTSLVAGSLAGCIPEFDTPDDDAAGTDGGDEDDDGDDDDAGNGGKGLSGGGGDDGADDGEDDGDAEDDGAADDTGGDEPGDSGDSGDVPGDAGQACVSYCATELTCDDYYEDTATCESECAASAAEVGACVPEHDGLYACLGALDCDAFGEYWAAVEMLLDEVDPGPFPCAQELIALAECADA